MGKKPTTIYLNRDLYHRLKELVSPKPISQEIDHLMRRRIIELKGEEYDPLKSASYEALKAEYTRLIHEAEKIAKLLKKRGNFDKLVDLSVECGIDQEDLSNIHEVAAKMLQCEELPKPDIHQFITLMEITQKRKEAEKKLEKIRLRIK